MSSDLQIEASNAQSPEQLLGATVGDTTPIQASIPQPNITTIEVDQLPEEYKGLTPTVKTLPPKIEKRTLPPQYNTKNLPPKDIVNKLKPLFPPGTQPFDIPNF